MGCQWITITIFSLVLFLSNLPTVITQAVLILPTTPSATFPACAFTCSNLNAASSFCTQTNVGESQEIVSSCFCQRAEVTPFYLGPAGVCDDFCTVDSDRSTLQTWFQTYCAAAGFSSGAGGTVTTLITSTRTPASTATGTARTDSGADSTSSSSQNEGWFASHWRWVVMVIALLVGLSALAVLAICLKRRRARKAEERRVTLSGFPAAHRGSSPEIGHGRDMWGPHQHMAHTRGYEYTNEQDREIREASGMAGMAGTVGTAGTAGAEGGGLFGIAIGKAKNTKDDNKRRLSKKSKHGSQRSARDTKMDTTRTTGDEDENTRMATAAVRRSRSERRREREREREREKEIERGLRGLPPKNHDEKSGNEKQMWQPAMSEKEKDIS